MQTIADHIIDAMGGTTAVSRLTEAPLSTVHSWRKNGIPPSRLAHLKLAAQAAGKAIIWETGLPPGVVVELAESPSAESDAPKEAAA